MNWRAFFRALFAWGILGFLFIFVIFISEGRYGFIPFLNLEALFLVLAGTILMLWVSYPMKDILRAIAVSLSGASLPHIEAARYRTILNDGATSAMAAGAASTVLGMILMLASISDVSAIPRRVALALAAIFFAYLLSEYILTPLSRRLSGPLDTIASQGQDTASSKRQFHGLSSFGLILLSTMTLLYCLAQRAATSEKEDFVGQSFIEQDPQQTFFNDDTQQLTPIAQAMLKSSAERLKALASTHHFILLECPNVSDRRSGGQPNSDRQLSAIRAARVARFLIDECTLPANRVATIAFSERQQPDTAKSHGSHHVFGRIEIKIAKDMF